MSLDVGKRRLVRACAIVIVLVASLPISGWAVDVAQGGKGPPAVTSEGIDASSLIQGDDAQAFLSQAEALLAQSETLPGDAFQREIGCLAGAQDIRANAAGNVVGYLVQGKAEEVFGKLSRDMAQKGWTEVPLGSVEGATYVKQGGACRWALATCTQVGDVTSVVMRGEFE